MTVNTNGNNIIQQQTKTPRSSYVRGPRGTFMRRVKKWQKPPLSKETVIKIVELYFLGLSVRKISKLVQILDRNNKLRDVPKTKVHKIISGFAS